MNKNRAYTIAASALLTIGLLSPIVSFSQSTQAGRPPQRSVNPSAMSTRGPNLPVQTVEGETRDITPDTPSNRAARMQEGRSVGMGEVQATAMPQVNEIGGERNSGTVQLQTRGGSASTLRGGLMLHRNAKNQTIDTNKLYQGADLSRAEDLKQMEGSASRLDDLRAWTNMRDQDTKQQRTIENDAVRLVEGQAILRKSRESSINPNEFTRSAQVIESAQSGNVLGEQFADCQETLITTTVPTTSTVYDDAICERIVPPNGERDACTREYVRVPNIVQLDQDKRAFLNIGADTEGEICRVSRNLGLSQVITPFERIGTLELSLETGGKVCTRRRWATTRIEETPQSFTDTLGINNETGGQSYWAERRVRVVDESTAQSMIETIGVDPQRAGLMCTKEHWPSEGRDTVNEVQNATLLVNQEQNNRLIGARWRWPSNGTQAQNGTYSSTIDADTQTGGLMCRRAIVPSAGSQTATGTTGPTPIAVDTQPINNPAGRRYIQANASTSTGTGTTQVALSIDTQTAGQLCERRVWPENVGSTALRSASGTIGVNQEAGGLLCSVSIQASASSATQNLSESRSIAVSGETSGQACTRNRYWTQWYAAGSSYFSHVHTTTGAIGAYSRSWSDGGLDDFTGRLQAVEQEGLSASSGCWGAGVSQSPNSTNSWTLNADVERFPGCGDSGTSLTHTGYAVRYQQSFADSDSGNCGATSAQCSMVWSCLAQAPVGSLVLTPGANPYTNIVDTYGLANGADRMYPGAPGVCISAALNRTCTSTGSSTRWRLNVPVGTTGISNVAVSESPDVSGVSLAITEMPSAANNYYITVTATRTYFGGPVGTPNALVTYTVTAPSVTLSRSTSGNCDQNGTANCSATWTCDASAPTTINGQSVTAAMAATQHPFHSSSNGVLSTACVTARKHTTCGGSSTYPQTISIASAMAGATSIVAGSFSWDVTNPQSGVTVTKTADATAANGWVVSFSVTRTNWSYTPANPNISMTWSVPTTTTQVSVRTTSGDCNLSGSANCPAAWSCTGSAGSTTTNGIAVTSAMTNQVYTQLYSTPPGGTPANTCAVAVKSTTCSGSAGSSWNVNLSANVSGQTNPRNFRFTVLNPQAGVTVTMPTPPTAANGWLAGFSVTRTNFTYQPVSPNVRIDWDYDVTSYSGQLINEGDVATAGTAQCPTRWRCAFSAPRNNVSVAMANGYTPFWNAINGGAAAPNPNTCQEAVLERFCSGSSSLNTTVALTGASPSATSVTLSNVTVTPTQAGVTVTWGAPRLQGGVWVVDFTTTRSGTGWTTAVTAPSVTINWSSQVPVVNTTVTDYPEIGNCASTGTPQCPVAWSCPYRAPRLVGGYTVDVAMANARHPLYPGAPLADNNCQEAHLSRTCSGTATTVDTIVIPAANIPAGVTSFQTFTWNWTNAPGGSTLSGNTRTATGASVTLTQVPTQANGWTAQFSVARTDFAVALAPPAITLNWVAQVPVVNMSVQEDPAVTAASGTTFCPLNWGCTLTTTNTVNGISVTAGMVSSLPPLYLADSARRITANPVAPSNCLRGELRSACTGSPNVDTTIQLTMPPNTVGISDFGFDPISVPANVTVTVQQVPSAANGWRAILRTTRNNWTTVPASPQVRLRWNRSYTGTTWETLISDPCDEETTGSANCTATWSCGLQVAPAASIVVNGVTVTQAMVEEQKELYEGQPATCMRAERNMVCTDTATTTETICFKDRLPPNTVQVQGFGWRWLNNPGNPGLVVAMTSGPTAGNEWCATFEVRKTDYTTAFDDPQIELYWNAQTSTASWSVVSQGNPADTGSTLCPAVWSCPTVAPAAPESILWRGPNPSDPMMPVTAEMVQDIRPLLWSAAPPECLRAELNRVCAASHTSEDEIDISHLVGPTGATQIEDYSFTINNPQDGVTITELSAPTHANGWRARFQVTRTDFTTAPQPPSLTLNWVIRRTVIDVAQPDPEEGNCADPGSEACPTQWQCVENTPFTLSNGVELVESLFAPPVPPLYPDAAPSCVIGELHRVCNGEGVTISGIAIGDLLPEGVNEIEGFDWDWINEDPRLTIELVEPPSEANGWRAVFRVTRNYAAPPPSGGGSTPTGSGDKRQAARTDAKAEGDPPAPEIRVRWSVRGPLEYDHEILTLSGDCSEDGSEVCPAHWVCDQTLPSNLPDVPTIVRTIAIGQDGNPVVLNEETTSTDLSNISPQDFADSGAAELYFGEQFGCWEARKVRICEGNGATDTFIPVGDQLPTNTTVLNNVAFEVITPMACEVDGASATCPDFTIEMLEPPTLANNWTAHFRTARTSFETAPEQPEIRLFWSVNVEQVDIEIIETGDCTVQSNSFCNINWLCTGFAAGFGPEEGEGGTGDDSGTFPGNDPGAIVETTRAMSMPPAGEIDITHSVSIAEEVSAGLTTLDGFSADVVSGEAMVFVQEVPSAANGWTAELNIIAHGMNVPRGMALVRLMWVNVDLPDPPTPPPGGTPPIGIGDILGIPPLYPIPGDPEGTPTAPPGCIRAVKRWDCSGINDGSMCTDGGGWCEEQEGHEFDSCQVFEDQENCTLQRTQCLEGGAEDGHCYVESQIWRCSRTVDGESVHNEVQRVCTGATVECMSGECNGIAPDEDNDQGRSMKRTLATWAVKQAMTSDWIDLNGRTGPGLPPPPGCEDCIGFQPENRIQSVGGGIDPSVKARAAAKTIEPNPNPAPPDEDEFDPFALPEDYQPPVEFDQDDIQIPISTPANPVDVNNIQFFKGNDYNCAKQLGGLINCCTKRVPNEQVSKPWWENFTETMRANHAGIASCVSNEEEPADPTGTWDEFDQNADMETLMQQFTTTGETNSGGGDALACLQPADGTMAPMHAQFVGEMHTEVKPNLSDWFCDDDEFELATQKELGACHYIGSYCQTSILGICIDNRERYCCFNSPMSKMIRVSLAQQYPALGFGTAKDPQCGGISAQDLARLNMETLDYEDLEGRMTEAGITPDLANLLGTDWESRLTGEGSLIGNEGRMDLTARTEAYANQVKPEDAKPSIAEDRENTDPTQFIVPESGPATITWEVSYVKGRRGTASKVALVQRGGDGTANWVRVKSTGGTALPNVDYGDYDSTYYMGSGPYRLELDFHLWQGVSFATETRTVEYTVWVHSGNGRIFPNEKLIIEIPPETGD